ncbi:TrbC family F-type conjugative pilus assembly protein [Burkholderia anthina]|uniref:TrbC family F-type conjugative pilus assembly protein n=1 Tax=Burkholderia anthina TaxID=179879 RepID=UPI0037BFAF13
MIKSMARFPFFSNVAANVLAAAIVTSVPATHAETIAAPISVAPIGTIDGGLADVLNRQADALLSGNTHTLTDVPQLRRDVPESLLQSAQAMLEPSRRYVVQNLSAGQENPDAGAMANMTTVVFISTSMPEASLKALFKQASGRKDVALLLRGWKAPYFRELIGQIKKAMPQGKPEANVFIDPQAFEKYGISTVPVTIHKRAADKRWYQLTGEISVDGAIEEIERGRAGRVVGNTYAIAEPNILDVIRDRMARVDWKKQTLHARQSALQAPFNGVEMPVATASESHLFDPSITLSRDVTNPANGQLLAARGTRVNPLDLQPFPYTVVAIDPYDGRQMRWATNIVKSNPRTLVYVTRNAMHADGRPTWSVLGTRTFTLNEQAVSRFDIHAVPTRVVQEGRAMRVTTYTPASLASGK